MPGDVTGSGSTLAAVRRRTVFHMTESLSPLTVGLAAAGVITVIVVISVVLFRMFREVEPPEVTLPQGADAALWSIVEAVPDPRNHLALTRDLSGEVRITDDDRALAEALFADSEAAVQAIIDVREPTRDRQETGASIDLDLTERVFSDESHLTRS
jgi:hypothetical protein